MAISNSVFPPIVDTYMPAFVPTGELGGCRVYFSFSPFQDVDAAKYAQISVTNQKTNKNELNEDVYVAGIKRMLFSQDDTGSYYVTVNAKDLKEGFTQNTFYKVQIRLDDINENIETPDSTWLTKNLDKFSEWSSVCLIKAISKPTLAVAGLSEGETSILSSSTLQVSANLTFEEDGEDETLKQYRLYLLNSKNEILIDSGLKYANSTIGTNQFTYTFKYDLLDNQNYVMQVDYATRNLYEGSALYNFSVVLAKGKNTDIQIEAKADEENGRNKIYLATKDNKAFSGRFIISRSGYASNFTLWEDLHEIELTLDDWQNTSQVITRESGAQDYPSLNQRLSEDLSLQDKEEFLEPSYLANSTSAMAHAEQEIVSRCAYLWCDKTPESGIFYRYRVQEIIDGVRSNANYSSPVMNAFDYMFLVGENRNLKIKFNSDVYSYKYNVVENKIDTIGGQYPFIQRNGDVYYRQIPISGLVTFLSDDYEMFTNKTKIMLGNTNRKLYQDYNSNNNISNYNDYIYERLFREEVIRFLQDGKPKLLKTLTEGNILVRLMDINLTPLDGVGRRIYSFSATAYEQAAATLENIFSFNIQSKDKASTIDAYLITQDEDKILTNADEALLVNIAEG